MKDSLRKNWMQLEKDNQSQEVSRAQDEEMVYNLTNNMRLNRTMEWSQKLEDKISSLSVADINKLWRNISIQKRWSMLKPEILKKRLRWISRKE
ncbi:MAG: hypothetical protein R2766_09180 [Saprospiraceae bacterium]